MLTTHTKNNAGVSLGFGFLATAALWILTILVGGAWGVKYDPAIAAALAVPNNYFCIFLSKLLCYMLHPLYMLFPAVNWWFIFSVNSIALGAGAAVYVIYRKHPPVLALLFSLAIVLLVFRYTIQRMNFTQTAVVIAIGGAVLILQALWDEDRKKLSAAEYIAGVFLLIIGSMIRFNSGLIVLGFLAADGFILLVQNGFALNRSWFRERTRSIVLLCLSAVLFFGVYFSAHLFWTDAEKEYIRFNKARSAIQDYQSSFPDIKEDPEAYEAIGLKESGYHFLIYFAENSEFFPVERIEEIDALKQPDASGFRSTFINKTLRLFLFPYIYLTAAFLLFATIFWFRRNWFSSLILLGFTGIVWCYLVYGGRLPDRVIFAVIYPLLISSLSLLHTESFRSHPRPLEAISHFLQTGRHHLITVLCLIPCGIALFYSTGRTAWTPWHEDPQLAEVRAGYDALNADEDHIFILAPRAFSLSLPELYGPWESVPLSRYDHCFHFRGWNTHSPWNLDRLAKDGISNMSRALFERDDVFSTYAQDQPEYTEIMINFLHDYYDPCITLSGLELTDEGFLITKYSAPVDESDKEPLPVNIQTAERLHLFDIDIYMDIEMDMDMYHIQGKLNAPEADGILFCNLTSDGKRLSYRLGTAENGAFEGYLFGLPQDFDLNEADPVFFYKTSGK